jgi:PPK2 family polyphosphate:nucleotide phosphotransferase
MRHSVTPTDISRKRVRKFLDNYRVTDGRKFRLRDYDPADTAGYSLDKPEANALLEEGVKRLAELQEKLYAQHHWAMLCAFQAMDAAGKDSTIKHVMSGVNPQGVLVTSFKAPGPQDLDHDFLWRINQALPERGRIGIFNRSHYEEVLVVRVHPDILERQRLPRELVGKKIWDHRLEAIGAFEHYLTRQGTVVRKFFLNVSKEEQKKRFRDRLRDPAKRWKFSVSDLKERGFWDNYQAAYQDAISATAAPHAPWYIVPADNKWFTHLVVVAAINEALHDLDLRVPELTPAQDAELEAAWNLLEQEDG